MKKYSGYSAFSSTILNDDFQYILKNLNLKRIRKKKILILGGNSFLAAYLQAILGLVGCDITSVSLNKPKGLIKSFYKKFNIKFFATNLTNEIKVKNLLKKKFDYIFHCASYGQPQKWIGNELNTVILNVNLLKLVLEHSKKFNSKILYFSSAAVYDLPKSRKVISEKSSLGVGKFFGEIMYIIQKLLEKIYVKCIEKI